MKKLILLLTLFAQFVTAQVNIECPADATIYTNGDGVDNYNNETTIVAGMNLSPAILNSNGDQTVSHAVSTANGFSGSGSLLNKTIKRGLYTVTYTIQPANLNCNYKLLVLDREAPKPDSITKTLWDSNFVYNENYRHVLWTDNCDNNFVYQVVSSDTAVVSIGDFTKKITRVIQCMDRSQNTATATEIVYRKNDPVPEIEITN